MIDNYEKLRNFIEYGDYVEIRSEGIIATKNLDTIEEIKNWLDDHNAEYKMDEDSYTGLAVFKIY